MVVRADAVLNERVGQRGRNRVRCLPSRAMGRNDNRGLKSSKVGDCLRDSPFEGGAGQMQAADEGADGCDAGERPGVEQRVDRAGMGAALGNIAIGVGIGVILGLIFGLIQSRRNK